MLQTKFRINPSIVTTEKNNSTQILDFVNFCTILVQKAKTRECKMTHLDLENFLADFISQDNTSPYFWNLVSLSSGNLSRYTGPKTEDEFWNNVKNRKAYGQTSKENDETLLNFYLNLNSPDVKRYMYAVRLFAPLVARFDQMPSLLQNTGRTELDCYNEIVLGNAKIQNQKLRYDILTRILEKTRTRTNGNSIESEQYKILYNVARFFRSICDWAKTSTDSTVRENLIADKLFIIRNHQTVPGKLKLSQDIMNLMMQKLENTIKTAAPQDQQSSIRAVCQEAYHYVSYAGAGNQDFVNKMWDVFNWRDIVNVPAVAAKAIKR